jgi:alkanesulfonate monooxygenase SsuD/methylene tetrahydromethanopterin reductase-like flavin-dependent oxidoreductase (luciferase family)
MKAAFFSSVFYLAPASKGWPTPAHDYTSDAAKFSMRTALAQFRLADEVGFDWVTLAEHHFGPFGLTPNPMVFAGALTQVVRRAKIALLGPTLPILNPVRVAEEYAMLDTMTDGRIIAGLMRGTPNEYVTYNINPMESRGRFEEGLQLIRRAWTERQPFGWEGRYFKYRSIAVWPRPVQEPHPPIYMSGSSRESAEFAARNRVSLGLAVTTVPLATKAAQHYRDEARRADWEPSADDVLFRVSFHVADSDEQALADYEESRRRPQRGSPVTANPAIERAVAELGYYGADVRQRERVREEHGLKDRIALGRIIIGSPDTVVSQIAAIDSALRPGVLDVVSAFQLGERTDRSIVLFGQKVLPRIREL